MKLDHVAIWAVDIELMRAFYEKYFDARSNLKYENERKRFTSYFLTFPGGGRLELMHRPSARASLHPSPTSSRAFGRGARSRRDERKAVTCRANRRAADRPGTPRTRSEAPCRRSCKYLQMPCKRAGPRRTRWRRPRRGLEGSRPTRRGWPATTRREGRYSS